MLNAIRRLLSPTFRLHETFAELCQSLDAIRGQRRYSCVDWEHCFDHGPRELQYDVQTSSHNPDPEHQDAIARALRSIVHVRESHETFDLRKIIGTVDARGSSRDRSLAAWGATLPLSRDAFGLSPEEQVEVLLAHGLKKETTYMHASWAMDNAIFSSNPYSAESLAQAISIADRNNITREIRGVVQSWTADESAALDLCEQYGAWVFDLNSGDVVKMHLRHHGLSFLYSFIGRRTPSLMESPQVVIFLPSNQPMFAQAHVAMTDLLWEHKCKTIITWLRDFKTL